MAKMDGSRIGLFMTSDAITIVEVAVRQGRPLVTAIGSAATPEGCVENGTIFEPSRMAQAIRLLMRQMNVTAESACVAFPSDAYSMRSFRFPEAPLAERRSLVRGELDQAGMLAPVRDEFDFLWLPAPEEQGRKQADASVYFSDAASVESVRDTLRLAGLEMVRLEPASITLLRAYTAIKPAPVAVLCPFRKHSDLAIFDGAQIRSVRRIPTGYDDFLKDGGIQASPSRLQRTLDGVQLDPSASASQSEHDSTGSPDSDSREGSNVAFLASEVARSLAFFSREFPEVSRQQKLVILGEDAVTERLSSLLQGTIPVPASHESPVFEYSSVADNAAQSPSAYNKVVAIGAALGGAVNTVPVLNLAQISEASRISRKAPGALLAGMSASAIWMVAAMVAAGVLIYLSSQEQSESASIARQTAAIQAERAPLLLRQQAWDAAQAEKSKSQVPAASVLGRVAASTTPGVALTSLKVTGDGKVSLEGKAINPDSMQRFAAALGKGKAIKSPAFEAMHKDPKEGLTFRIVSLFHAAAAEGKSNQFQ
jgi:Tfp pilus assembly PilM family ATPase